MATAAVLELNDLLEPIPGDDPAGVKMPYTLRQELDDDRKDVNPDDFDTDDPRRPDQAKKADWAGIVRKTTEALRHTGKDMHLAARLTEALTKLHGFPGLRDGLQLMHLLLEQCWDRLSPPLEGPDDLEIRAAPFNWLDDAERGALFPNTVRGVPIVVGEGAYSWLDWKQMMDGKGPLTSELFDKAIQATPREKLQTATEELEQVTAELQVLTTLLNDKLGAVAPAFTSLRPAVGDCQTLVAQILQRMGTPAEETVEETPSAEGEAPVEGAAATATPRLANREQVYRQLATAAARLQELEPHSPVPFLIAKAVEFGNLSFPQLMRQLIRDDNVLTEMNRELGIKEEAPPEG